MNNLHLGIFIIILLSVNGCTWPYHARCKRWDPFFFQPLQTQKEQLASMNLETQFEINFCGLHDCEPPRIGFYSPTIARRGSAAIPFLKMKIIEARGGIEVWDVVGIFADMHMRGYYNVAADRDLMAFLEAAVAKMRDSPSKELAEIDIGYIH